MTRTQRITLTATALVGLALPSLLISSASATPSPWQSFEFSYGPGVNEDFCDVAGLTAIQNGTTAGRARAVVHGPDGLTYEFDKERFVDTWTNPANGQYVTVVGAFGSAAHKVTDNGDGTNTVLVQGSGHDTYYDQAGDVIAREAGTARFSLLFDNGGTPTDPSDDEFLEHLGYSKRVGSPDVSCPAIVAGIS